MFYLIIWCILFPDLLQYLIPWARVGEASSTANDPKQSAELWNWLEDQVKDIWANPLLMRSQEMIDCATFESGGGWLLTDEFGCFA